MATYTDTLGFYKGNAAFGAHSDKRQGYLEVVLDFAKIKAARSAASATALAAGDILQVMQIPANAVILHAGLEVTTAETTNTTGTFDLGFTGGTPEAANYFYNDGACNALAVLQNKLANAVIIGSSADTIDLLLNTAVPQNAVIRVFAFLLDPN